MQVCQMIVCLLKFGLGELLDRHSVAPRVLLLVGLFLVGYAEATILKSRGLEALRGCQRLPLPAFGSPIPLRLSG